MSFSVSGKNAIVTGAGSGINLAFASVLLRKGCNVLIADLALRPEASELLSKYNETKKDRARAFFQETNVREWKQLERMFEIASKEFGGVDIVCPGAGVYEPAFSNFWQPPGEHPSADAPDSNAYALIDINLTHPIRTTQLAISHFLSLRSSSSSSSPDLRNTSPKHIIHISSIAGQVTPLLAPMYNATKHAINGFVRTLAPLDTRLHIRVTAVAPGVIKTPLWTDNPEKLRMITETDKWVTPEFVAETMVDLVEKESLEVSAALEGAGTRTATGDARKRTKSVVVRGGSIIEVAAGTLREVLPFMDVGPNGEGNTIGNLQVSVDEVFERLEKPGWGQN